ncbi:MAG: DinB family protein [Bryobacteraceae bacterium]
MTTTETAAGFAVKQHSGIARALGAWEKVRNNSMAIAAGLSQGQVNFRPDAKSWSIGQNLDRLVKIDSIYREHIQKLIDLARDTNRLTIVMPWGEGDPRPPIIPAAVMPLMTLPMTLMNMFVPNTVRELFLRYPLMPAVSPQRAEPHSGKSPSELMMSLQASFEETRALLVCNLPPNVSKVAVVHPVFGRNTISDILGLMTAHELRHGIQMEKISRSANFPSAGA